MKNKRKIIILSILLFILVIVTGLSVTYAYWTSIHVSNNNIISSSCLDIEFNSINDSFNLDRTYPGDHFSEFVFSISNKCSVVASYDINLETLEGSDLGSDNIVIDLMGFNVHNNVVNNMESLNNFFDEYGLDYLKRNLIGQISNDNLSMFDSVSTTLDNALYSNKLFSGVLNGREAHLFTISSRLSSDSEPSEVSSKHWSGKVVVNSTPLEGMNTVSFDTGDDSVALNDISVIEGEKYGELPQPRRKEYAFLYWYLDDENNIVTEDTIVTKKGDHVLKAKWTQDALLRENAFRNLPYEKYEINEIKFYDGDYYSLGLESEQIREYGFVDGEYIRNPLYNDKALELQVDGSAKVYAWIDGSTLYYYSDANTIYFNKVDGFGADDYGDSYRFIKSLDFSRFNTSVMTDMSYMFAKCESLEALDLSDFDTSNVINMHEMFSGCYRLEYLYLNNFNTANVMDMGGMFEYCARLTDLDLSFFETSKVIDMSKMFACCESLTRLDLTNFTLLSDTNIESIFYGLNKNEIEVVYNNNTFENDDLYDGYCCGSC